MSTAQVPGMHTNIFLLLMFSTLIVLALFGNLLVVAAIFWDRHLRRQPENLFLVSLAVSDLLVSILVMLFAAANDLLGYWPFGSAYCQFWISFDITCSTASILNLCAISLDRYCHISRPMVYVRYCNRRRISYAIFFVWFLSGLIGAAPMAFGFGSKVTMHNSTRLPVCEMRLPLSYAICSSMMSFFLPAAMMVFLYTKLYLYARKHVRSIQTQLKQATSFLIMQLASEKIREDDGEDSCDEATAATLRTGPLVSQRVSTKRVSTSISTGESPARVHLSRGAPWESVKRFLHLGRSPSPIIEETPSHPRATVSDQKARLTLGVIMGTFLVCWLPFFLVNIWRSWDPSVFSVFTSQAVTWLGYANSTANPVIYSIFNRDFRRAFKKILFEIFHCCEDKKMNSNYRNGCLEHQNDRRKSYTRSSEANNDNNNIVDAPVATRLVLLNNNESSVIVEE